MQMRASKGLVGCTEQTKSEHERLVKWDNLQQLEQLARSHASLRSSYCQLAIKIACACFKAQVVNTGKSRKQSG